MVGVLNSDDIDIHVQNDETFRMERRNGHLMWQNGWF
jgi:hypothetical protein